MVFNKIYKKPREMLAYDIYEPLTYCLGSVGQCIIMVRRNNCPPVSLCSLIEFLCKCLYSQPHVFLETSYTWNQIPNYDILLKSLMIVFSAIHSNPSQSSRLLELTKLCKLITYSVSKLPHYLKIIG